MTERTDMATSPLIAAMLREIPDDEGYELRRHVASTIAHLARAASHAPGDTIRDLEALISLLEQHGGVPDDLRSELAYLIQRAESLAKEAQWRERLIRWNARHRPNRLVESNDWYLLVFMLSVYLAIVRALYLDPIRVPEPPSALPHDLFRRRQQAKDLEPKTITPGIC